MKKGQKLYRKAKKIILGGNMLFSKRPELFLPDHWPTYYSKAKGTYVWDLENKKYLELTEKFKKCIIAKQLHVLSLQECHLVGFLANHLL